MTSTRFGLTGNQLKLIAIILMAIDHVGAYILPQYQILRNIGRLAMPVFAFMIAEGCRYTKNRVRYLLTLAGVGVISQIINILFWRSPTTMNILFTFSLSVLIIYGLDYAEKKKNFIGLCVMGGSFAFACFVCVFFNKLLPFSFGVSYGITGVLLPVLIYMGKSKEEKLLLFACGLVAVAVRSGVSQWYSLLSVPMLALYNGQRGKYKLKYLFYVFYPLHLLIIYGIAKLIK